MGSTYVDLGDPAYDILARLEAEGVIESGLLTTKPISRSYAIQLLQEAEKNAESRSQFVQDLVRELAGRVGPEHFQPGEVKPLDTVYGQYVSTDSPVRTLTYGLSKQKDQLLNYNNDGDLYGKGSNFRVGFTSRAEDLKGFFSFYLDPEYRTTLGEGQKGVIKEGYAVLGFGWDLILGKGSQWWGPGYSGSLLLSNNAEAFTMAELTNPVPSKLPWFLSVLGPYRFTLFVTQLEKDRDVPEPYMWGMRFVLKPFPVLEIGLQRTGLLGGDGRPTNFSTWLHSIIGTHEHESDDTGDQRAGYDLKLTLPFRLQPVQLYWEQAGEENRQRSDGLPYKLADIYGIYLPRLASLERIGLRFEYANDWVKQQPYTWYTHHIYTSGYTYDGMLIGHHMGTDAHDLFGELSFRMPERRAVFFFSFERTDHDLSRPEGQTDRSLRFRAHISPSEKTDFEAVAGYGWTENAGNQTMREERSHLLGLNVVRRF